MLQRKPPARAASRNVLIISIIKSSIQNAPSSAKTGAPQFNKRPLSEQREGLFSHKPRPCRYIDEDSMAW